MIDMIWNDRPISSLVAKFANSSLIVNVAIAWNTLCLGEWSTRKTNTWSWLLNFRGRRKVSWKWLTAFDIWQQLSFYWRPFGDPVANLPTVGLQFNVLKPRFLTTHAQPPSQLQTQNVFFLNGLDVNGETTHNWFGRILSKTVVQFSFPCKQVDLLWPEGFFFLRAFLTAECSKDCFTGQPPGIGHNACHLYTGGSRMCRGEGQVQAGLVRRGLEVWCGGGGWWLFWNKLMEPLICLISASRMTFCFARFIGDTLGAGRFAVDRGTTRGASEWKVLLNRSVSISKHLHNFQCRALPARERVQH